MNIRLRPSLQLDVYTALAHVHAAGIIHQDVKLQNALVPCDLQDLRRADFNEAHHQRVEYHSHPRAQGTSPRPSPQWAATTGVRHDVPAPAPVHVPSAPMGMQAMDLPADLGTMWTPVESRSLPRILSEGCARGGDQWRL